MCYRSIRRKETRRVVDPYAVLQREGRWHLFGYCHLRRDTRLFRLDRMLEAEVLEETFERPSELEAPDAVLGAVANSHGSWEVRGTAIGDKHGATPVIRCRLCWLPWRRRKEE